MKRLLQLPLHFQILIAMVVGTVLGLALNPGQTQIDEQILAVVQKTPDGVSLTETTEAGELVFQQQFATADDLTAAFPAMGEAWTDAEQRDVTRPVTNPQLHLFNDGKNVSVRYARDQGDTPAVFSSKVALGDLQSTSPFLYKIAEQQNGTVGQWVTTILKKIGDLFMRLLKMVTIPLIVSSLITGVAGLGEARNFGRMFSRTLGYYLLTSMLAITVGLILVNIIQPGVGAILPGGGAVITQEQQTLGDILYGLLERMIPTNPIQALAEGQFLSLISFSVFFGVCIIFTGGRSAEVMREFFNSMFQVMMKMTMAVIALAPIGVLAFMTYATATQGLSVFQTLAWYMLTVFLALCIHACVVLPLLLKFVARRSPVEFAKSMSPALMMAFSTASSNGTLPVTMTSVEERAKVSNRVSSFVLPLGATINMDGTALYEAVAVLFIAQSIPGFDLTIGNQVVVAFTALLASVGAAGIPHAGLVMMAIVLQAVGLPLEAQGIILAVDRVLDMCRTTVNVWSDSCGCAVLQAFENAEATVEIA